jgi:DmsE family decaheme c-type cytochrome
MKNIRHILAAGLLAALAALPWSAQAADTLPSLGGGSQAGAARAQEALKKDAVCTKCHDETEATPVLSIYQTTHGVRADARTPTCQSCHGESDAHVKGPSNGRPSPDVLFKKGSAHAKSGADQREAVCQTCHKGGNRTHWDSSQHQANGVACNDCHKVHTKDGPSVSKFVQNETCFTCHKKQRAETHRISTHPIDAGKVLCSDCHNPHGSVGPKLVKKASINETCFTCHAEKRGPFLWQHASATDDCMNCHTPHGSTVAPLLKARSPWLCQECHAGTTPHPGNIYSGASLPGGPVANANVSTASSNPVNPVTGARVGLNNPPAQFPYRGCTNCHSQVHGSNHPAGDALLR